MKLLQSWVFSEELLLWVMGHCFKNLWDEESIDLYKHLTFLPIQNCIYNMVIMKAMQLWNLVNCHALLHHLKLKVYDVWIVAEHMPRLARTYSRNHKSCSGGVNLIKYECIFSWWMDILFVFSVQVLVICWCSGIRPSSASSFQIRFTSSSSNGGYGT